MVLSAAQYIGSETGLRQLLGHRPRGQNIGTGPLRSKTSVAGETRRSALSTRIHRRIQQVLTISFRFSLPDGLGKS
jgi:hypothetical protein